MCIYYVYWCVTRFPYRVMFMSLNRDTTGATSGAGIVYPIGAPELTKMFLRFVLINLWFLLFILSILLFVLPQFTTDYTFGICKPLFLKLQSIWIVFIEKGQCIMKNLLFSKKPRGIYIWHRFWDYSSPTLISVGYVNAISKYLNKAPNVG